CEDPKTGEHKPKRLTVFLALATLYSSYFYIGSIVVLRVASQINHYLLFYNWETSSVEDINYQLITTLYKLISLVILFAIALFPVAILNGCYRRYLILSIISINVQMFLHI
ncbi:MAG: hypothetical protein K2X01_05285, partial [Cyanobacteria bacterium]|nr:hypothetical protein [Cyanobacteriota bacterium]